MTTPEPDEAELARAIAARQEAARWVELRAFGPDGKPQRRWVGPGLDAAATARWAADLNRRGFAVYATRNGIPKRPDGAASRAAVDRWLYLLLDIDPERPAGQPADDAQRKAADFVADAAVAHLSGLGWPAPAEVVDSGNGVHVFYRLDLPADDDTDGQVARVVHKLNELCGRDGVKVDPAVIDRPRISRLPGSVNVKGGRLCRVVAADPAAPPVPAALFAELAGPLPEVNHPEAPEYDRVAPDGPASDADPWTDFNRRADWWADVLEPAGAKRAGRCGKVQHVTRPGKEGGTSATLGHYQCRDGTDALFPFTSSWPELAARKPVDKFGAFARLFHGGDFKAATRAARAMGYGGDRPPGGPPPPGKPPGQSPPGERRFGGPPPGGRPAGPWGGGADGKPSRPPPVEVPPYRDFPVHCLPDGLREFVADQAAALGCDPVFVAMHALCVAGAAAGNALSVRLKRGFEQPPLLWGCMVADSGTGKSPGLKPVLDVAIALNVRLVARYKAAVREYMQKLEQFEACEDADPAERPVPPVEQTFLVEDASVEELIVTASDSAHGLVMVHDELAVLFGMFTRYKGRAGGSDVGKYLKMYDAGWTDYRRRTGTPRRVTCDRTFLAVAGGIQPAVLKAHLSGDGESHISSGLAARFLLGWPPKRCLRWTDREPSWELESRFREAVFALADLPYDPRNGPTAVRPDPAALRLYAARYDLNAEAAEGHDGGPMAATLPKASGQAARLALIHFAVGEATAGRDPGKGQIPAASMAAGVELAEWFVHEAGRVYAMLRESEEDNQDRTLDALCRRLIERKRAADPGADSVVVRDLVRTNRPEWKTSPAAELALESLVAGGRWREEPRVGGNGRWVRHFLPVGFDTAAGGEEDGGGESASDGQA